LCAFLLPRINMTYRILILAGGLFLLINANYYLVASFSTLMTTLYIALELVLFMVASPLLHSEMIAGEKQKAKPKAIRPPRHVETAATVGRSGSQVRELRDAPEDAINVSTTALGESGRQATAAFGDHQTINLDGDDHARHSDSQPTPVDSFGDQSPTGLSDSGDVSFDSDSGYDLNDSGPLSESQQFR